ncbi:MFS transporter [Pseudonocardia sp. MH-G8]|uniref:MFS transporter n=1 Tax=Pseudonocardia sp. MH-G8 TaxID=1854588 RepID=UPI000BA07CFC|nr:MFS transporter [Pseudonocardia sp. MH-G8]OZM83218.1 MFS transporter [Pseudonocardia sp. MH-G8]
MTQSPAGLIQRHGPVVAVCVGGALTALDLTIVNVALPQLGDDLGSGLSGLQWVVNAYTLAFASLILTAGALSDRLGDRPVFGSGVALFTFASAGCGVAPSAEALIAARAVQGIGAAAILATSISLLARSYEGPRRAATIGAWVMVGTLAANLGPLVGGVLVDGLGWRGIFLVNVPIGLALLLTLRVLVPGAAEPGRTDGAAPGRDRRPDIGGVALAVTGLFALNFAVLSGSERGWRDPAVLGAAGVAVLGLAGFVLLQRARGERAMFDLRLFRIPSFSAAILLSLLTRMASFGALPFFVLWMQGSLGLSATATGLCLLALSLPVLVLASLSGPLQRVLSARILIASGNLAAAAGALALLVGIGPDSGWAAALPGFALIGAGAGLAFPSLMGIAVGVVTPDRAGMASGMANTFFPLGTAVGVAVFGVVSTAAPDAEDAVVAGLDAISASMAALCALGVLVALTLIRDSDRAR